MSKKQKSTTGPSKFAKPYISSAANSVNSAYSANAGNASAIGSAISSQVPGLANKVFGANPLLDKAKGYATDVLGGKYLTGNPQLDAIIANTNSDVANKVNASIGSRGRTGGDAHSSILTRELAKNETGLRYQNYGDEMDRMTTAAGMAPGLNAADYEGIAPLLAMAQAGIDLPTQNARSQAELIAQLMGNYSSSSQGGNTASQVAQGAGTALQLASMFSDRRLKRAIEKVGEFVDGLGLYEWTYVWGGDRHRGVMADEVESLRPWALGPVVAGYATVNYGAL